MNKSECSTCIPCIPLTENYAENSSDQWHCRYSQGLKVESYGMLPEKNPYIDLTHILYEVDTDQTEK